MRGLQMARCQKENASLSTWMMNLWIPVFNTKINWNNVFYRRPLKRKTNLNLVVWIVLLWRRYWQEKCSVFATTTGSGRSQQQLQRGYTFYIPNCCSKFPMWKLGPIFVPSYHRNIKTLYCIIVCWNLVRKCEFKLWIGLPQWVRKNRSEISTLPLLLSYSSCCCSSFHHWQQHEQSFEKPGLNHS